MIADRKSHASRFFPAFLLLLGAGALLALLAFLSRQLSSLVMLDLGVYLASSYALATGANPWDAAQLTRIAHAQGYLPEGVAVLGLWTPPTAQVFLLPLTLLPVAWAKAVYLLATTGLALGLAVLTRPWWKTLTSRELLGLVLSFPPFLALLVWGQITGWVALGYVLFVLWAGQKRDLAAGLSLLLVSFKPHLVVGAWLWIAIWILRQRRWTIGAGALGGLGGTLALATLINPAWPGYYLQTWLAPPLVYEASSLFRLLAHMFPAWPWVQFSGMALLIAGTVYWGLRQADALAIRPTGDGLLALSVMAAPYGWCYDQVVLWPFFIGVVDRWRSHPLWRPFTYPVVAGLNVLYYVQFAQTLGNNDVRFFWFPWALAGMAVVSRIGDQGEGRC